MKVSKIPKGNGKVRTIYAPSHEEKEILTKVMYSLREKVLSTCDLEVVHAFLPGHNSVTNAKNHTGYEFTFSFDIKDFFDSIEPRHVKKYMNKTEIFLCFVPDDIKEYESRLEKYQQFLDDQERWLENERVGPEPVFEIQETDGHPRQGLPTSPDVANLAGKVIDDAFKKWVKKKKLKDIVYTRYADDISVSFNDPELIETIREKIKEIVHRPGFKLNESKTHLYSAKAGNRVICGVAVNEDLQPTRATKRKLRAAEHQRKKGSAAGLREWMFLKEPNSQNKEAGEVRKAFKLKVGEVKKSELEKWANRKVLSDKDLRDNAFITNDLAYFLGMSDFTTGWGSSSCYKLGGQYKRAPLAFLSLKGASLAVVLSDNTKQIGNIEKRKMEARALIFQTESGDKVLGRIYGNNNAKTLLKNKLKEEGFTQSLPGKPVMGTFKRKPGHVDIGKISGRKYIV